VLEELRSWLGEGLKADYITISGSGEPTLNSKLAEFIKAIKAMTDIPVAVITNGSLLVDAQVRRECELADLVVPSLDATDDDTLAKICRPAEGIGAKSHIEGLCAFRQEYDGLIWLEIFLVEGINTSRDQLEAFGRAIERIKPDKVQLNTAVRPTTESGITAISAERMGEIASILDHNCEIVASYKGYEQAERGASEAEVLEMVKRRPCSLDDICIGLGIHRNEALKYLGMLQANGKIVSERKGEILYFK
jgi:wyosine [tRNA(Phe)-imidazoG37] synthetase (radical SAM superfamily)